MLSPALTQRPRLKHLCLALIWAVEEADKLIDDGCSVRVWRDIGGD
jgi:hypothetical protein